MFSRYNNVCCYILFAYGIASRRWVSLFRAALRSAGSSFIVGTPVNARRRRRAGVAPSPLLVLRSPEASCDASPPLWRRGHQDTEKEIENSLAVRIFYGVARNDAIEVASCDDLSPRCPYGKKASQNDIRPRFMESERIEFLRCQQLHGKRHVLFRENVDDWSGVIRTARKVEYGADVRNKDKNWYEDRVIFTLNFYTGEKTWRSLSRDKEFRTRDWEKSFWHFYVWLHIIDTNAKNFSLIT